MSYSKRKKNDQTFYDFWNDSDGVRLKEQHTKALRSGFPPGCGTSLLVAEDLNAMRELCDDVLKNLPRVGLVPWGDGWTDRKTRGYAMLPDYSNFKSAAALTDSGIVMHDVDSALSPNADVRRDAQQKHDQTISKSFVAINPPANQMVAIEHMIQRVNEILHTSENLQHLQPYERDAVCISNLVAIQPNFHNGDDYLPLHLDNPRHDGFGVVIVTVAVWGSADIVLVDDGDPEPSVANFTTTTNTTEEQGVQDEEVRSESTVDLSIARHTRTSFDPQPSPQPVVLEGGIVYKDGAFVVSVATDTVPVLPSDTTVPTPTTTTNTDPTTANGRLAPDNTMLHTTTNTSNTTNTTNTITAIISTTTAASAQQPDSTAAATVAPDTSKSWAFHLSPGQLYVLSGPARNKCAHGVVVDADTAPIDIRPKRQRSRSARTSASAADGTSDNASISTEASGGSGSVSTTAAAATALPNLSLLAKLSTSSCTTAEPTHTAPTTGTPCATTHSINTTTNPTYPMTSPYTDEQPKKYKGRVSLNFRFGLHTAQQAYEDIDRHWG